MTQWGMLLLCMFIVLGVGRTSWRKAGTIALLFTVIVLGVATTSYMHSTPHGTYINDVDASIYATGNIDRGVHPNSHSTEDTSGIVPANDGTESTIRPAGETSPSSVDASGGTGP